MKNRKSLKIACMVLALIVLSVAFLFSIFRLNFLIIMGFTKLTSQQKLMLLGYPLLIVVTIGCSAGIINYLHELSKEYKFKKSNDNNM